MRPTLHQIAAWLVCAALALAAPASADPWAAFNGKATSGSASSLLANTNYYFHGYAGGEILGDAKFYDRSGAGNHGTFGANLSNANAWANSGYVSTVDPASGTTDSGIKIPALNFNYTAGEKIIIYWLGKVTPEGSDATMMGDGFGSSAAGIRVRAKSTGKFDVALSDSGGQVFSGISTGTPFDGTLHSIGIVFDGSAKKYGFWFDDAVESTFSSGLATFNSGNTKDTRTSATFNIGNTAGSGTDGIVVQTRALVILRLPPSAPMPTNAQITAIFQALRANPGQPVARSAF